MRETAFGCEHTLAASVVVEATVTASPESEPVTGPVLTAAHIGQRLDEQGEERTSNGIVRTPDTLRRYFQRGTRIWTTQVFLVGDAE